MDEFTFNDWFTLRDITYEFTETLSITFFTIVRKNCSFYNIQSEYIINWFMLLMFTS